jgi:hypothetical protein
MATTVVHNGEGLVDRVELARRIRVHLNTLDRMRKNGLLPRPFKLGKGPGSRLRWSWPEVLAKLGRSRGAV